MPAEDNKGVIDLLQTTLANLERIEGVSKEEYLKIAVNAEVEFAPNEADNDIERNRKDTQKLVFSPTRFLMERMHHTADESTITNPDKLIEFTKKAVLGELPLYWESKKIP